MLIVFLAATVLAAVFLLHCAVVGRAVLRWGLGSDGLPGGDCVKAPSIRGGEASTCGLQPLALFFSICLGMLVNMAGLFLLGIAGHLHLAGVAWMALALLVAGLAAVRGGPGPRGRPGRNGSGMKGGAADHGADRPLRGFTMRWRGRSCWGGSGWLEAAMLAVLFLLSVAVALHPPGHWDDTMYQLQLARDYVQQQAIVLNEYLRFPLFPQNFNLLFVVGLMLGDALQTLTGLGAADIAGLVHIAPAASAMAGDTAGVMSGAVAGAAAAAAAAGLWRFGAPEVFAQMFASLPLFVMALGLWAASRRYTGSGIPGLLAGLTLFMIGPVKSTLGFAYIDNGLALFCWAATLAAAIMNEPGRRTVTVDGSTPDESARHAGHEMDKPGHGTVPAHCSVPGASERHTSREVDKALAGGQGRSFALPALAGLLAGAACGTKYFGVVLAALIGATLIVLTILQERRKATSVRHAATQASAVPSSTAPTTATPYTAALRTAAVYAAAVLLAGSWWYVRSAIIAGDPVHPAGARLFGFFLWNEDDLARQHAEQALHGVVRNPLMLPSALLEAGVLLWLPAFAGLFLRRLPPAIRVLQAVFLAYMLFWFFVTQVPRYLAPVYGVGGFLAFHALHHAWLWAGRRRQRKGAPAAAPSRDFPLADSRPAPLRQVRIHRHGPAWPAALALILIAAYAADRAVKYGREFVHAQTVLATNGGYLLYQQANAHIGAYGSRLVQIGFEDGIYFFQGTVIGDWFGPGRYRDLLDCPELPCALPPPAQLESMLHAHGARMLLVSRRHVDMPTAFAATLPYSYNGRLRILAQDDHGVLLGVNTVFHSGPAPRLKD
ncbi:hypothetical protein H0A73_16435 [Alcaligenaceae bacterium]|nr:hypothetical protein [Alcaligenaceae bacterium]